MMWGPYGFGGMAWMPFLGVFFWVLIFVLGIVAVRAAMGPQHRYAAPWHAADSLESARSSGLSILDERYARGEINRDEYLQKRQDIVGPATKG